MHCTKTLIAAATCDDLTTCCHVMLNTVTLSLHRQVQQEGVRRWVRGGVPQHRTMLASDADLLDAVKALVPKLSGVSCPNYLPDADSCVSLALKQET